MRVSNIWNDNYIEYESNGDKNKTLSIKEYPDVNNLYLKNITDDLQKFDGWKIPLTIAINFIPSKDIDNDSVMHSNNDNMINQVALLKNLLNNLFLGIKLS